MLFLNVLIFLVLLFGGLTAAFFAVILFSVELGEGIKQIRRENEEKYGDG